MTRTVRYQGAIVHEHQLLLIQHREHATGRGYWVIPGGGQEAGESEEECVRREMREETWQDVVVERLLFDVPAAVRGVYQRRKTYLCRVIGGEAAPGYEPELDAAENYGIVAVPCDPRSLHHQSETYEHLGAMETSSLDLHERYQALTAARHIIITPQEAHVTKVYEIAAPPAVVWDWANDPQRRSLWMHGTTWAEGDRPGGRTGAGARNHCAHGKNAKTLETVLDWKPFEYYTAEQAPNAQVAAVFTCRFEPLADGQATRLTVTIVSRSNGSSSGLVNRLVSKMMYGSRWGHSQDWDHLARLVAEDYARQPADASSQAAAPGPASAAA